MLLSDTCDRIYKKLNRIQSELEHMGPAQLKGVNVDLIEKDLRKVEMRLDAIANEVFPPKAIDILRAMQTLPEAERQVVLQHIKDLK